MRISDWSSDVCSSDLDVCRHQMLALAQARLGRRVDIVTGRPELIGYRLPAPAAMKGAMNENEGRLPRLGCEGHVRSLSQLRGTAPSRFKARARPDRQSTRLNSSH